MTMLRKPILAAIAVGLFALPAHADATLDPEAAATVASLPIATDAPAPSIPDLTPEELALLPEVDAIDAATDLRPFLRAGVPKAQRDAALRRGWLVDPAILNHRSLEMD
jgi:hypothetical protein